MSDGGGAGDRRGVAALAGGGRPVAAPERSANGAKKKDRISIRRTTLLGLDMQQVAVIDMLTDSRVPELVMYAGNPFLIAGSTDRPELTYIEVRAYRVDAMIIREAGQ